MNFIGPEVRRNLGSIATKITGANAGKAKAEAATALKAMVRPDHYGVKTIAAAAPAAEQGPLGRAAAWLKSLFAARPAAKPAEAIGEETLKGIGDRIRSNQAVHVASGRITPARVEDMATRAMELARQDPARGRQMMQAMNVADQAAGRF